MAGFGKVKAQLRKEHDRSIRARLRRGRRDVQSAAKDVRKAGRLTLDKVREQCRRSRQRVKARAEQIRAEARQAANAEIDLLKESSRGACEREKGKVRKRTRTELAELAKAERAARADEHRERSVQGVIRRKEKQRAKALELRSESDDEVRANLDPALQSVWNEMKAAFKGEPGRRTRTEAFLEWAEANPDEVLTLQIALAEADAERFVAEQAALDEGEPDPEPPPAPRSKKRETFREARKRLAAEFEAVGFRDRSRDGAKVPKFQRDDVTIWLKPQAAYVAVGNAPSLNRAHSLTSDYRGVAGAELARQAERMGEPAPF